MIHPPLSRSAILTQVDLLDFVPASIPEPQASKIRKLFRNPPSFLKVTSYLAIWSDGTWAVVTHNGGWTRPRPRQLIRAYQESHSAGFRLDAAVLERRAQP